MQPTQLKKEIMRNCEKKKKLIKNKKTPNQSKRVAWLVAILNVQIYKRNDKETRKAKMTIKKEKN